LHAIHPKAEEQPASRQARKKEGDRATQADPHTGTWSSAGNTIKLLTAFPDSEIGPAVLMRKSLLEVVANGVASRAIEIDVE
jgi:hypothetical protein